jgi:class 3 adenylate cyclase
MSGELRNVRSVDAERLATITTTLCLNAWDNKHLDSELLRSLDTCLSVLEAAACVTRYSVEDITLTRALPSSKIPEDRLAKITELLVSGPHDADGGFYREVEELHIIGVVITEPTSEQTDTKPIIVGYSALCFIASKMPNGTERGRMVAFHSRCTAPLLWQVLQQRTRVFLPVSPRAAVRYWNDAARIPSEHKMPGTGNKSIWGEPKTLVPPWNSRGKKPLRTVTLGFDLRKSTFCMENADDPIRFAGWLDDMVQILMRISHHYGGIFDKFTGDGALVHFPEEDHKEIFSKQCAVTAAVVCAVAMQKGMSYHLRRLRKILRLDSKVVGGAIGVDIDWAHWTLDERDNPITVGRGVVNACRLMDSTKAGCIRLTNIAYQTLDDQQLKSLFFSRPFTSKEFGPDMGITAWELQNAARISSFPVPGDDGRISQICKTIWDRREGASD